MNEQESQRGVSLSVQRAFTASPLSVAHEHMQLIRPADTRPSVEQLTELLQNPDSLSHTWLIDSWRRSLRYRRWAMLDIAEKGLFRCALWVAKARGKISNKRLVVQVLRIVLKLLHAPKSRIAEAGTRRAMVMFEAYAKSGGVFNWAPRMREWLRDPRYIWYLGIMEVNS